MTSPAGVGEGETVDATDELAQRLGIPVEEFVDVFGAEWRQETAEPWHVTGTPVQVMLRVFHHGVFVARPTGVWEGGSHGLAYRPERQRYASAGDLDEARELVRDVARSRRRSFTWCRCCRTSTPPELRISVDTCMGCASRWEGVVC